MSGGPAIDLNALKALFGDDRDLCRSILDEFCLSSRGYLGEFRSAEGLAETASVAHKLKSSAATVGARALADCCQQLESACRAGQQAQALQLLPRLTTELERVCAFVAALD